MPSTSLAAATPPRSSPTRYSSGLGDVETTLFGDAVRALTGGALAVFCLLAVTLSIHPRFNPLYKLSALTAATLVLCLVGVSGNRHILLYARDRFLQRYTLFTAMTVLAMFYSPYELSRLTTVVLMFALAMVIFAYVAVTGSTWPIFYGLLCGVLILALLTGGAAVEAAQEGQRLRYGADIGDSYLHPNKYGFLLLTVFFLSLKVLFVDTPRRPGIFNIAWHLHRVAALIGIALAAHQIITVTGSRKAVALLLISGGGAGILYLARRLSVMRLVTSVVISIAALAAGWIFVTTSPFFERLITMKEFVDGGGLADGSSLERTQMMRVGLALWLESPIFGHGPGYFLRHAGFGAYSHANPVELLVSLGLAGALLYYGAMWAVIKNTLSHIFTQSGPHRTLAIWVFLVMCLLLISEIGTVVVFGHVREHSIMLGTVAAFAFRLRHQANQIG